MFDKLQEILVRPISGYEVQKIMNWINDKIYTEEEILNAYEYCEIKTINYIAKYLESKKSIKPSWYNKKIEDKPLSEKEIIEYQKIMKEFYSSDEEFKKKTQDLLKESKTYYN